MTIVLIDVAVLYAKPLNTWLWPLINPEFKREQKNKKSFPELDLI